VAVVSSGAKEAVALAAGADRVVRTDDLVAAGQVDVVLDVVGGDAFTDSLRLLKPLGRLLVVGFAAGQGIPEVRVNRLLLNNIDVRGVGWGAYAMTTANYMQEQWRDLEPMLADGTVKPPIGATYALDDFGLALEQMEHRRTLGKSVVVLC
jgi:NADPH:quinone reductase